MKLSQAGMLFLALTVTAIAGQAQNSYQLFAPVNTRLSTNTTPTAFGTLTVNLNCTVTPITASVSSSSSTSASPSGYVFSDNYIGLTVNTLSRKNICTGGFTDAPEGGTDCFNSAYTSAYPTVLGDDPDTFVSTYGVPGLDISSDFAAVPSGTPFQAKFELLDFGTALGSSSVWLNTNCTKTGIAAGGSITGNPVTPNTPTQTFSFDDIAGQRVQFIADYSAGGSTVAPDITVQPNTFPVVNNQGLTPSAWAAIVKGTSFATTSCVPDSGEVDSSGNPLCKFSTILCTNTGTPEGSTPAGDNCPQSKSKDVRMFHEFDAASNTFSPPPNGILPPGTGIGFLMGSDNWPGSSCVFEGPETGVMCPQNPLTSFLGDFKSGSGGSTTNSTFIVVAGVPLPYTLAWFTPNRFGWSNNGNITVNFLSVPPLLLPSNNNGFIAAPIQTLTYGIDDLAVPVDTSLPIAGDVTLPKSNPVVCPHVPTKGAEPLLTSDTVSTLSEGSHVLHYFSTDCAGTEELVFTPNIANQNSWTSFKTLTIKVDTTLPFVVGGGPTLSPSGLTYVLNQPVFASYSCSDPAGSGGAAPSGVVVCGPPGALPIFPVANTGTRTSKVNTSSLGTKTFTVNVQDLAGNVGVPMSVTYTVVKK